MIVIDDDEFSELIALRAGMCFNHSVDHSIARLAEDGSLLGGIVYSQFVGWSIGLHIAAFDKRWINPDLLWIAFDYPFNQLGVHTLFGQVPANNAHALKFDKHVGFKEVARIEGVFKDEDLVVLRMFREECRYLKTKHTLRCEVRNCNGR